MKRNELVKSKSLSISICFLVFLCYYLLYKAFPPLGNSDHVGVSVSRLSIKFTMGCLISCADWDSLCDHLKDVPWEDIFKLSPSAAASEFCEWVQVGIDIDISHCKYHVKLHSSPWFSAACAAAVVHRNHFFCL